MAIISYVVFENEDDAIKFHKEWFNNESDNLTAYGMMVASYKLPTLFCDEIRPFIHKREGWTYRETRGWWVCPKCLRPSAPMPNILDFSEHGSYGKNIIEKIKSANLGDKL